MTLPQKKVIMTDLIKKNEYATIKDYLFELIRQDRLVKLRIAAKKVRL